MRSIMRISMDQGFTILLLFLSFLFCTLIICHAVDTITTTQLVTDGKTIVSSGGSFELGFFSPVNSRNRYLGIWYKKISSGTVVWVANRENPINDTSGVLKVTNQGTLTLLNRTNSIIWSSNTTSRSFTPVAQLLESGNLVVKEANDDNPENFVWQSFDYPCDTALPGMKIGRNMVTGIDRHLRSWKTSSDPSRGDFTVLLDVRGFPQLVLMKGSVKLYRSGPWNGLRFSGMPGLKPNPIYTFGLVFNQEEAYYSYQLINSSVLTRLVVNQSGVLQRLTWNHQTQVWTVYSNYPADNCDTYGLCYAYGSCNMDNSPICGCPNKFLPKNPRDWETAVWSNGCVRRTPLMDCHNGDGFVKYPGVKLPDAQYSWFNKSMTLEECERVCLKNCTCMAYANLDIRGEEVAACSGLVT